MRSQGCTIQQALTPEAAAVVKQAVALAKRRGHAQVTPLHVAHTMLTVTSGLLRAACLQAHSHPFQCRALELCFNVALNRLPTSASGPMLGPHHHHHHHPTIANALVAAFKRAQAHQRRGLIENQQQPLLAVKIELEQLIISILDDPSVSRVMREAGFSSTLVKSKVEQAVSIELGSQNQGSNKESGNNIKPKDLENSNGSNSLLSMGPSGGLKMGKLRSLDQGRVRNEDVMSVMESLMSRGKRNRVVVGECIETLEGIVRDVMDRVENGGSNVSNEGLKGLKFVQLGLSSFVHLSREEVEQRVAELKCFVKSYVENHKGVVLYLGDLKWATNEFRANSGGNFSNILGEQHQPRRSSYSPIEHMIMEIEKLIFGYAECGKLWLLGIATYQTYTRCKSDQPSLEATWGLHPITVPSGSLSLSLLPDSNLPNPLETSKKVDMSSSWLMLEGGDRGGLVDDDSRSWQGSARKSESTTSSLPPWLQQCKNENTGRINNSIHNNQDTMPVKDLPQRWGSICTSSPLSLSPSSSTFERALSFSSISPSSSTSNFSYDHPFSKLQPAQQSLESRNLWFNEPLSKTHEQTFTLHIKDNKDQPNQQKHATFVSHNPNSIPTPTSSSDIMDQTESLSFTLRFKECNVENLKNLCNELEKCVPHQKDLIYDIASTVLHCRSRMGRRKGCHEQGIKEDTWLFFQGDDIDAKEKVAKELAKLIFGSQDKFVSIGLSSFSSTRAESLEDSRNKRLRDEQSCSYIERFAEAVSSNSHRVFFVEDIEQVDYLSQMGIKKAIERGRISRCSSGEEVSFGDAIIILSCERFSSRSRACSPTKLKVDVQPQEHDQRIINKGDGSQLEETSSPSISLDLNISINDDENDNALSRLQCQSIDEIGLTASVDRCIIFRKHQEL